MKRLTKSESGDDTSTESDDKPETIFEEVVEGASGVCQNCYRRTHEVDTDWWPDIKAWEPIIKASLTEERWYARSHKTVRVPNAFRRPAAFPALKRSCECGMIDTFDRIRPLKKQDTIDYTHHVANRLDEASIPYDRDILFDEVRAMKEDPDEQYPDEEIYAEAVETAVDIGVVEFRRRQRGDEDGGQTTKAEA